MIAKLKNVLNTEEKKRLLSNFLSLSVLQGANYIFPLITLPYLVRVLGVEYFGLLAFANATIAYFNVITDYGFNRTATREISIHRNNPEKVVEIFSSVIIIKTILLLVSFAILSLFVFSFDKFAKNWEVFYFTFGTVIGHVLFPVWFFQGIEKMKYITFLNISAKSIFTAAIFIFVQKPSDYYIVPLLNSIGVIVTSILSLIIIKFEFGIAFKQQKIDTIKYYLKNGWFLFVSSLGVNMYKNNTLLILGMFSNTTIVGYFSIAKKIIDAINQMATIISNTIFPYINHRFELNRVFYDFLINLGKTILLYTLIIFACLLVFAEETSLLISGDFYPEISASIKIMGIVPLIIAINIPAVHILLLSKNDRLFSRSVLLGGVVNILGALILIPNYSYQGASFTVLLTEVFVTILLYIYAIKIFKRKLHEG